MLIEPYSPETEQRMKTLYKSLNERDRRRYAAVEADKLGYGGQSYISQLLGCGAGQGVGCICADGNYTRPL